MVMMAAACDLRSGTAKKEMERWSDTPSTEAPPLPAPAESPVDPADAIQVDTSIVGEAISINAYNEKRSAACKKFDLISVNGGRNTITIKGACRQIMVNGDANRITADAAMEIVFNGSDNSLTYAHAVNGKPPTVSRSREGNIVEHVSKQRNIK